MIRLFGRRKKSHAPDPLLAPPIETERFVLRPCEWAEAIDISWSWAQDPEILRNLSFDSRPRSRTAWAKEVSKPDNYRNFTHAICPKSGGVPIGTHRLQLSKHRAAQVALTLRDRDWWGKGAFEEIRAAVMDRFFRSPRCDVFRGVVHSRNMSSIYNYRKLGFRYVGMMKHYRVDPADGAVYDVVMFEMLRDDWLELRAQSQGVGDRADAG